MARRTTIYFATDLHGSNKCFRKFLNAGRVYAPDVLVLGGDVAGKALQGVVRKPGNKYRTTFRGVTYELDDGPELQAVEAMIADHGFYPYRADPGELEALQQSGGMEGLFFKLMRDRLADWLQLADERLRPQGKGIYWMLGNDDPPSLGELLDHAPWGEHAEGKVLPLDDTHSIVSWGFSNKTPWNSYREMTEDQLRNKFTELVSKVADPRYTIFNFHVPPFDTGLDEAPVLDQNLQVQTASGQAKMAPVGSLAVRETLEAVQPLVGLHGHIHESAGFRKIGQTIAINPGSDYGIGTLNGVLVTLAGDRVKAHQLVRG